MEKPHDPFGILGLKWVSDEGIAAIDQHFQAIYREYELSDERLEQLERAVRRIHETFEGPEQDRAYERLEHELSNQRIVVENARSTASYHGWWLQLLRGTQLASFNIVEFYTPLIQKYVDAIDQQAGAVQLAHAKLEIEELYATKLAAIAEDAASMLAEIRPPLPAPGGGGGSRAPSSSPTDGTHVHAADYTTDRTDGSGAADPTNSGKPARGREDRPTNDQTSPDADKGRRPFRGAGPDRPDSAPPSDPASPDQPSARGSESADRPGAVSASSGQSSPLSGLGSAAGGLGGSGGGSPLGSASGLTGGLGGFKPSAGGGLGGLGQAGSPLSGGVPRGLPSPSFGSGGGGVGAGSGATGGGSRIVPPPSVFTPSAPVLPPAAAVEATGAVGSGTPFIPATAVPSASMPSGAAGVGGGAFMGPAPMVAGGAGVAPVAPPAAVVGAAPTPSPGLVSPAAAAGAAAGAGAGAAGGGAAMSVIPAAMTDVGPEVRNQYADLAVSAVQVLAPAMAVQEALSVAAAVVLAPGGIPQVVVATNDGAGFLPAGVFLPPSMLHAFTDVADYDFNGRWFGWIDPARTLLAYAQARSDVLDASVQVLGLASSSPVSAETKNLFPAVVPSVAAVTGSRPLEADRGRNAHRLKVVLPEFYADVQALSAGDRQRAAVAATGAAMASPAAAPLCEPGGAWHMYCSSGGFTEAQWAQFAQQYEADRRGYGLHRPGLMEGSRPGEVPEVYVELFGKVRACETLLPWRDPASLSLEDLLYTAFLCGADLSGVFN